MFITLIIVYVGSLLGFVKPISSVELMMIVSFMIAILAKHFRAVIKLFTRQKTTRHAYA